MFYWTIINYTGGNIVFTNMVWITIGLNILPKNKNQAGILMLIVRRPRRTEYGRLMYDKNADSIVTSESIIRNFIMIVELKFIATCAIYDLDGTEQSIGNIQSTLDLMRFLGGKGLAPLNQAPR